MDYEDELERISRALHQLVTMRENALKEGPSNDDVVKLIENRAREIGNRLEIVAYDFDRYHWSGDGQRICRN